MFNAVLFDLFGTLIDDVQDTVYRQMSDRLGIAEAVFREHWSKGYRARTRGSVTYAASLSAMCEELGLPLSRQCIDDVGDIRFGAVRERLIAPRRDVSQVLAVIARAGLPIGLISNASPEVSSIWGSTTLASHFVAAIFSCQVHLMKPDHEIYQLACEKLSVRAEHCLYVGDGADHELEGAASVGMTPVQIGNARPPLPCARYLIDSLDELLPILGLKF